MNNAYNKAAFGSSQSISCKIAKSVPPRLEYHIFAGDKIYAIEAYQFAKGDFLEFVWNRESIPCWYGVDAKHVSAQINTK